MKKKQKKNPHKLGGEQVSKVLGNLCNIFVAEKLVPLTAFVRPDDKQTSSLPEGCTAQLHKPFPLLGVQSPARSLFPPGTYGRVHSAKKLPADWVSPTSSSAFRFTS